MQKRCYLILLVGMLVLASLVLLLPLTSEAGGSVSGRVGFTILPTQSLAVFGQAGTGGQSVTSTFVIPTPTAVDLARGFIERDRETVLVAQSNLPWLITVRTPDEDMGQSADGRYSKPISDLWVRAEGGPYITISNQAQVVARGGIGQHEIGMDYRVQFDGEDYHPGNYHITLIYTISGD